MIRRKKMLCALTASLCCFYLTACFAPQNIAENAESGVLSDVQQETDGGFSLPTKEQTQEEPTLSAADQKMGRTQFHTALLGENVYIFSPQDDPAEVQKVLDRLWNVQETNQFGEERYAVYFLPGEYDENISVKVGYYMQVSGLGAMPDDTVLTDLNCDARWLGDDSNHNATCNFWRGVENLCVKNNCMWAVSQATYMRRVHMLSSLYLHDNYGWASGGFLSNSVIDRLTDSGTQQQWLSRNCDWKAWMGENWNMVFAGIEEGKAPTGTWPGTKYTTVPEVELIREKPFLAYEEEQGLGVYVPDERSQAVGVDWNPGTFLPLEEFYVARPGEDTADTINAALQAEKHLLLTPGVYELDRPIVLDRPGTVCLGTGLATLRSMNGNACLEVTGDTPVTVAGILFDTGPKETACLMTVGADSAETAGEPNDAPAAQAEQTDAKTVSDTNASVESSDAPFTLLADLFFRVGGAKSYDTNVDLCIEIAQDRVIGDNFWVWRADHSNGVGWTKNRAKNGILVSGNDVTIYALMVEHFQEYQTIWNGDNGKVIFYQCEIPYDVPKQEEWRSHDGKVNGFASYKIGEDVTSHEAWGLGIYLFNRDASVELHSAMELPESADDIRIHNICTVMITGKPGISHIINERGNAVMTSGAREIITEYPEK